MNRTILVPPDLTGPPLRALQEWLGIAPEREVELLTALLTASLDMCEAFTGAVQLATTFEETLPIQGGWLSLRSRPVHAIVAVEGIPAEGARFALPIADYAIDITADGTGRVRVIKQGAAGRVAVRCMVGKSPVWAALPGGIRHGIVSLAAHYYRNRDRQGSTAPDGPPPAAVAALWRPHRRVRLT